MLNSGNSFLHRLILKVSVNIKIKNRGRTIQLDGEAENEYLASQVLEAINLGFSVDKALLLKEDENLLQILNIKDITKRNDMRLVRARLIGTHGKTKENLSSLTECEISLKDNRVGIIGNIRCIDEARIGVTSLIQGSKIGNVYTRLERVGRKRRLSPPEVIKNEFKKK